MRAKEQRPTRRKALIIGGGIAGPVAAIAFKRAGIDAEVYEAQSAAMEEAGAFLGLTPNGVNVLKTLGLAGRLAADGSSLPSIIFFNAKGRRIGELDSRAEEQRYGAKNVAIKRGKLRKAIRDEALHQGIRMEFGKRLTGIEVTVTQQVIAYFEDGTTARGDFLVGCDGIHSRIRKIILPDGPQPTYTGMVDCGGFSSYPAALPSTGAMHMIFGKRAFFGYVVKPDGEVYWFSNVAWPNEPTRDDLKAIRDGEWRERLLALHADDPAPIPEIIRATRGRIGKWPVYDMLFLPAWHNGVGCLAGDAAHATAPHLGQGASLAMEDAIVLAKCLRDIPNLERAFTTYQDLRKERVETIVKQARRAGDRKIPKPVMGWFRDLMLPFFLKRDVDSMAWVYSYKVDWDEKVAKNESHRPDAATRSSRSAPAIVQE